MDRPEKQRTAIVIGATGLVGTELVNLLLEQPGFGKILVFGRRSMHIEHPRFEEHIVDFATPEKWKALVRGDILFSVLGTTLSKAGSKKKQYEVDFGYQYLFAEIAAYNMVERYVLVSSMGANASSMFFYMRMKGKLDEAVAKLSFETICIIRPALLYGARKEKRTGEKTGLSIFRFLNKIGIMQNRHPIHAQIVARSMIQSLQCEQPLSIYTANELFELAGEEIKK